MSCCWSVCYCRSPWRTCDRGAARTCTAATPRSGALESPGRGPRHKLRKIVWAKLLSPLRRLQRIQGILPAHDELPEGQQLPSHPLWVLLGGGLAYKEVTRRATRRNHHINVLETQALVRLEAEASFEASTLECFASATRRSLSAFAGDSPTWPRNLPLDPTWLPCFGALNPSLAVKPHSERQTFLLKLPESLPP